MSVNMPKVECWCLNACCKLLIRVECFLNLETLHYCAVIVQYAAVIYIFKYWVTAYSAYY